MNEIYIYYFTKLKAHDILLIYYRLKSDSNFGNNNKYKFHVFFITFAVGYNYFIKLKYLFLDML